MVNTVDKSGRSPAMFACYYSNVDAIELLSTADANLQLLDRQGRSVMHYAAQADCPKLIQTIFLTVKGSQTPCTESKLVDKDYPEWQG